MALVVNKNSVQRSSVGNKYRVVANVALDNSYPTGGYLLNPQDFGITEVETVNPVDNKTGYLYDYNTVTGKILLYSGSLAGTTVTIDPASAGTPAGTVTAPTLTMNSYTPAGTNGTSAVTVASLSGTAAAQTFTGSALATHNHNPAVIHGAVSLTGYRIYVGAITGTYQVGETVTGGTSGSTAVVVSVTAAGAGRSYITVSTPTGEFKASETVTGGTSAAHATTKDGGAASCLVAYYGTGGVLHSYSVIFALSQTLASGINATAVQAPYAGNLGETDPTQYRYNYVDQTIEVLNAIAAGRDQVFAAFDITSDTSAGTPAGTNGTSAVTGTGAGTAAAQTFSGTPAVLTGANSTPTFAGSAMGTHIHTASAGGVATFGEVANATNLSAINNLVIEVIGL